jgi:cytidine deaminase
VSKVVDSQALRAAAFAAMANAHAPYSGLSVGAAIETENGEIVAACNVENATYPLGLCAEHAAVAAAVAKGARHFRALAIATNADVPTPPCGACRQVLCEFGEDVSITSYAADGSSAKWTLTQLLPAPFVRNHLQKARQ